MMHTWNVELQDEQRVPRLVDGGGDAADVLDRLIADLDERGSLSRDSLGTDPVDWWARPRRLWRLVEPAGIWWARPPGRMSTSAPNVELLVVRGYGDVLLLLPPGTARRRLEPVQLLGDLAEASRSEPYARADSALSCAMGELGGPEIDLGRREPLAFDSLFRRRPEEALFDLGFALDPAPAERCLARLTHVYDLVEDFLDRPLPRGAPIGFGDLIALWSRLPADSERPTIILLMSLDDEATLRLVPHLERSADEAGYRLEPLFALSAWARRDVDPEALGEQLERACTRAAGPVAALVVHYGVAFSTDPSSYRTALTAFRARHPDVPMASEALLGQRSGHLHGVAFDQPAAVDFILEQLGF